MLGELPADALEDARQKHRREMLEEITAWIGKRAQRCHLDEAAAHFALASALTHGHQGAPRP